MPRLLRRRLYTVVGPDDIAADVLALDPLHAVMTFHAEALGQRNVHIRRGEIWFRRREDQSLCAGRWTVCQQAVNDGAPAMIVEIPEPDEPGLTSAMQLSHLLLRREPRR
jgi:hypothetical protein